MLRWELKEADNLKIAPHSTEEELKALRSIDPANLIMGNAAKREKLPGSMLT